MLTVTPFDLIAKSVLPVIVYKLNTNIYGHEHCQVNMASLTLLLLTVKQQCIMHNTFRCKKVALSYNTNLIRTVDKQRWGFE